MGINAGERGDFMQIQCTCAVIRDRWGEIHNRRSQMVGYLSPNDPLGVS